MAFSESLTVRILGDSSGLRRELDTTVREIGNLHDRLSAVSTSSEQLGRSLVGLTAATRPLQQVSQWLSRITQQIQILSRTPVSLNVQPALQSLQQLMTAAQVAANMLRLLSIGPGRVSTPQAPAGTVQSPAPRRFAAGGVVTGPPGLDRVATQLTAGEYVIAQSAVQHLGTALLDTLNSTRPGNAASIAGSMLPDVVTLDQRKMHAPGTPHNPLNRSPSSFQAPAPPHPATNNHFGGITIQVRETADVNAIVRDLRLQGIHLRNRRG